MKLIWFFVVDQRQAFIGNNSGIGTKFVKSPVTSSKEATEGNNPTHHDAGNELVTDDKEIKESQTSKWCGSSFFLKRTISTDYSSQGRV